MKKVIALSAMVLLCASCTSSSLGLPGLGKKWHMMSDSRQDQKLRFTHFYLVNHQAIKKDIAANGGEYLQGLSNILEIEPATADSKLPELKQMLANLKNDQRSSDRLYQHLTQ